MITNKITVRWPLILSLLAVFVHIIASSLSFLPKFLKVIILEEIGHLNYTINGIGHQGLACHWESKTHTRKSLTCTSRPWNCVVTALQCFRYSTTTLFTFNTKGETSDEVFFQTLLTYLILVNFFYTGKIFGE